MAWSFTARPPMACAWPDDLAVGGHRFHGGSLAMLAPVRYEHEVTGYLQAGFDACLPKPFSRGDLVDHLRRRWPAKVA